VREVAAKSGARLLDLEKECEASPNLRTWFMPDGIHFSPAGRDWLGDRIARFVRDDLLRE
jgi:lysophospholipase L1-like esterase